MSEVTIIGVDLAKNVFHLHGAAAVGSVVFRKKLTRVQFHKFMSAHPACLVAMEACGSAHYRARAVAQIVPDWSYALDGAVKSGFWVLVARNFKFTDGDNALFFGVIAGE